jgi:anti-sigma B factor antagonist
LRAAAAGYLAASPCTTNRSCRSIAQFDRVASQDGTVLLHLRGELDLGSTDQLARALAGLPATVTSIVLELRGVDFMDSSGLAALIAARNDAVRAGRAFRVTGAAGSVRLLLDRTATGPMLETIGPEE